MMHSEKSEGWFHGMTNKFGTNFNVKKGRKKKREEEERRAEGKT